MINIGLLTMVVVESIVRISIETSTTNKLTFEIQSGADNDYIYQPSLKLVLCWD